MWIVPKALERAIVHSERQVRREVEALAERGESAAIFPFVTRSQKWVFADKWSGGFFVGQLWRLGQLTGEASWFELGRRYALRLAGYRTQGHFQDIGYLLRWSCALGWDVAQNEALRDIALEAADNLSESVAPPGYLTCSWLKGGRRFAGVDGMMNNALWLWATQTTGRLEYRMRARLNVDVFLKALIREDGGCYEYARVRPHTGEREAPYNKNASSDAAVWARGQAWSIYGLSLLLADEPRETERQAFSAALRFFLRHTEPDLVPLFELNGPAKAPSGERLRDASAAAAIACAILRAARHDPDLKADLGLVDVGRRLLATLTSEEYLTIGSDEQEGIMRHASSPLQVTASPGESQVWGDYLLLEALALMQGHE